MSVDHNNYHSGAAAHTLPWAWTTEKCALAQEIHLHLCIKATDNMMLRRLNNCLEQSPVHIDLPAPDWKYLPLTGSNVTHSLTSLKHVLRPASHGKILQTSLSGTHRQLNRLFILENYKQDLETLPSSVCLHHLPCPFLRKFLSSRLGWK